MKKIFFLVLLIVTMIRCDNNGLREILPVEMAKSYIEGFVNCKQLRIGSISEDCEAFYINEKTKEIDDYNDGEKIGNFALCIRGFPGNNQDYYGDGPVAIGGGLVSENSKRIYQNYLEQIGDTCFNMNLPGGQTGIFAITVPLNTISITCNKDFDKEYPAGSELNGLFTVFFDDTYATVKNNYKQVEGTWTKYNSPYKIPHSIYIEKLSEANFSEHPFIHSEWNCVSNAVPEKTDEYTFHVKVTFVDGTELEGTAPPVRIEGSVD